MKPQSILRRPPSTAEVTNLHTGAGNEKGSKLSSTIRSLVRSNLPPQGSPFSNKSCATPKTLRYIPTQICRVTNKTGLGPKHMPKPKGVPIRVLSIPGRTSGNRYFQLLMSELEREGITFAPSRLLNLVFLRFDILHLNFPTYYITQYDPVRAMLFSAIFAAVFVLGRISKRAMVYTVHDVTPLEFRNEWLLWPYLRLVHRLTDGYVFLNASSQRAFVDRYPTAAAKPWVLAPHGPYPVRLRSAAERTSARDRLGAQKNGFLVGFLGDIKEYKGLEAVRRLPRSLAEGRSVQVVVAGEIYIGYLDAANQILTQMLPGQLIRIDDHVPDEDLDMLMQAVDVVFLPYKRGSNSGAAVLALSNHARIIGSDLPMFKELALQVGDKWISTFRSDTEPGSPSGNLTETMERVASSTVTPEDCAFLQRFLDSVAFTFAARKIRELYERMLRR
jgi:beta-1,4-mannosyltransferase